MEQNLFGQLLLNFNLVSKEQLEKCVALQKSMKPPKMLGEILVEQKVIDEKTLHSILSVQRRKLDLKQTTPVRDTIVRQKLAGGKAANYLQFAKEVNASDLYLTSGQKPTVRVNGLLMDVPADPVNFEECKTLLFSLLTPDQIKRYYAEKYLDFCMEVPTVGRFRTNIFRHYAGIAGIFRVIPEDIWPFERLGLPPLVRKFIDFPRGLVLITGATGSGKSTTMAALIDVINRIHKRHIVTIEDPIEFIYEHGRSLISQREVHQHTSSFAAALRAALREDPDVIAVGEMRDPETVQTAIVAAGTGHLVFGTLHTQTAHRTVVRILDQFPAGKRAQIRNSLATVLKGVVCQQLITNTDGKGRSLASEVMIVTPAIANLIREDRAWQIPMIMQMGKAQGMRLMDESLLELVKAKKISLEEAIARASDKDKFLKPE